MMAMAQPYHHPGGMPGQGLPHGHPMGPGNPHGMPSGQPGMAQMQMMGAVPGGPHVNQAAMMAGMPQMGPGQQMTPQMAQQMHIQNQQMQNAMNNMHGNPVLRQQMILRQQQQQQQQQHQAALAAGQAHPGMMMNPNGQQIMMTNGMPNPGMRVALPAHLQNQIPPSAHTPQNALQQQQHMIMQQQQQLQAAQAATQQHQLQQQQQHAQQQQQQAAHQAMMQQQGSQAGPSPAPSATTQPPIRPPSQIANRPDQPGMPPTSQAQPPQQQPTPVQQQQPPPQPQQPTMQQPQVSQPPQVPQVSQPQQAQQQQQQQPQPGQSQQQPQQAQQNQNQIHTQQTEGLTPQQQAQHRNFMMTKAQQMARQQQLSTLMGPVQGACVLTLLQFADGLGSARQDHQGDDSTYWQSFVARFFAHGGSLRQQLMCSKDNATKAFEITGPSLAWYYHLLFKNGVTRIELIMERATEKDLVNQTGHVVESPRTSLVSWYGPAHQVVSSGRLQVLFDGHGKIVLFEYIITENKEFIDRSELVPPENESPDQKAGTTSPKMSKKQQNQRRNTMLQHPGLKAAIERRPVGDWAVPDRFFSFLEVAENFENMRYIFDHASSNHTSANETLKQVVQKFQNAPNAPQNQQNADLQGGGLGPQGFPGGPPNQRTPGGPAFSSPAPNAHLALPGGNMTASPAMMNHGLPGQGGIAMVANPSQGGSGNPSATASPNNMQAGKKRRASQVKTEEDGPDKAKASPRMPNGPVGNAQKRMKG